MPSGPTTIQIASDPERSLEFAFHLAQVLRPFRRVCQVEGPFPIAMPLAEDDLLLDLRFRTGKTRLKVKREPHRVIRRVHEHVAILDRHTVKPELRLAYPGGWITEAFVRGEKISGDRITVGDTVSSSSANSHLL